MFSNIRITKIHDTSSYCISAGNLRALEKLPELRERNDNEPVVLIHNKQLLALRLTILTDSRNRFPSNTEYLSYLKQTHQLGILLRAYSRLPVVDATFTCTDLTLVEADLASNPKVKYRFYCCSIHDDTSGLTPVRWQCFQNGVLTSDLIYDAQSGTWWQYLDQPTGLYWLACGSNGFTENPGKYGVSGEGALDLLLSELYKEMCGHDAELIARESRRGKRIKRAVNNAVQSAFYHPESLCRLIYAKMKTLPEGIRK